MKTSRDSFHDLCKNASENPDARLSKELDPSAPLEQDLHCDSVESTPIPYVLNVGCGFRGWSMGRRTHQGVPINVVGADPLAFGIVEAMKLLAQHFPIARRSMFFPMAVVGEELSAAVPIGSFNAVWSEGALLDCVDPFAFLQQCVRATKTGGVVCVKLGSPPEGALWKVAGYDGGRIRFTSELGSQEVSEVRGERVEVHTLMDDTLMIKIRRREHTKEDISRALKKSGIVLPGAQ